MSISDYALKFKTLTAASGWNECSLTTTYRQGLNTGLWLHFTTYSDNVSLKKLIQLSIQVSHRVQQYMEEMQGQSTSSLLCPPEYASAPGADIESFI